MSINLTGTLADLHHDAVADGEAKQDLVECLKIHDPGGKLPAAEASSATAWDVIVNLDTALRAS
jgi:hypothetical protein